MVGNSKSFDSFEKFFRKNNLIKIASADRKNNQNNQRVNRICFTPLNSLRDYSTGFRALFCNQTKQENKRLPIN